MTAKTKPGSPAEVLKLTLEAEASPEYVAKIATMYAETLRSICPDIEPGQVTMEVRNFAAKTELRGWAGDGEIAVRQLSELIDNATDAVQHHNELATAARTLATYTAELAPLRPTFWRGRKKLREIDDVFVRTMRAAGAEATKAATGGTMTGDTVVYSSVLRIGRKTEGGKLEARVRVDGRFIDVDVDDVDLVSDLFEATKTGKVCQLRLHGQWVEDEDGVLVMRAPKVVGLELDYSPWSGKQILAVAREIAPHFTSEDFDRMLDDLRHED